jgi:hypothetical protein
MDIEILNDFHYFSAEELDAALLALTLLGYTKILETRFGEEFGNIISRDRFTIVVNNRFFYRDKTEIDAEGARAGFLRVWRLHNAMMDVKFYSGTEEMSEKIVKIPPDLYGTIAINLNIDEIYRLCGVDRTFKKQVCDNNLFWKQKFVHDYGAVPDVKVDWKKLYEAEKQIKISRLDGVDYNGYTPKFKVKKLINLGYDYAVIDDKNRLIVDLLNKPQIMDISAIDLIYHLSSSSFYALTEDMKIVRIVISGTNSERRYKIMEPMNVPPVKSIFGSPLTVVFFVDIEDNLWSFEPNMIRYTENTVPSSFYGTPSRFGMKGKMVSVNFIEVIGMITVIGMDDYVYVDETCKSTFFPSLTKKPDEKLYKTDIRAKMVCANRIFFLIVDVENRLHIYDLESKSVFEKLVKNVSICGGTILVIDMDNIVWQIQRKYDGFGGRDEKILGIKAYQAVYIYGGTEKIHL